MLRYPDKKTARNGDIYKKHFLKFRGSTCQFVEVTYINTPAANTIGKQAGTRQGAARNHVAVREIFPPLPDDWHSAEAVGRGGRISHLLRANLSQSILIRNQEGRLWHTRWDQGWAGCKREVVAELCWGLGHSSRGWDSPVRQLASRQSSQL